MDIETLCQKIIQQASKGGWDAWQFYKKAQTTSLFEYGIRKGFLLPVIFNHEFAKAFWLGNIETTWQEELKQLTTFPTDEQKLRYMEKFLTVDK